MTWTFVTNHAAVLLHLARDPDARERDLAAAAGITERAARSIVHDLEDAGYVSHRRVGRRNHYTVHLDGQLRHPAVRHNGVGALLALADAQPTDLQAPSVAPANPAPPAI